MEQKAEKMKQRKREAKAKKQLSHEVLMDSMGRKEVDFQVWGTRGLEHRATVGLDSEHISFL